MKSIFNLSFRFKLPLWGSLLIVVTALAGMLFSFFSRQHAPTDAPPPRSLHLPPSAKPDVAATAPATATPNPPPPAPTR